jgi:hypothetical protein
MADYVIQANPSGFGTRMQDKGAAKPIWHRTRPRGKKKKQRELRCAVSTPVQHHRYASSPQKKKTRKEKLGKRGRENEGTFTPLHIARWGKRCLCFGRGRVRLVLSCPVLSCPVLSSMIYISAAQQLAKFRWTVPRTRAQTYVFNLPSARFVECVAHAEQGIAQRLGCAQRRPQNHGRRVSG